MGDQILSVEGVSKKYCPELSRALRYGARDIASELTLRRERTSSVLRPGEFWALKDVSFDLAPGEALGLVGANGAGKSTLLRLIAGVTKPDTGRIVVRGQVGSLLSLGAGFDPVLSGRENIYVEATALGLSRRQITLLLDEIVDFAELGAFIDAPIQTYSSGMKMRLGFAVATSLEADLLLLDEIMVVGDIAFRRKGVEVIQRFVRNGGSLIFVSHEVWLVQAMCTRGIVLLDGEVEFDGEARATVNRYYERMVRMAAEKAVARGEADGAAEDSTGTGHGAGEGLDDQDPTRPRQVTSSQEPVRISAVRISGVDGGEVRNGEPALVEADYEASVSLERACWGFLVWTADRAVCIIATMSDQGDGAFPILEGTGTLRCVLRQMPLMASTYLLGIAVHDADVNMPVGRHGWDQPPTIFSVRNKETAATTAQRTVGVLVGIEVDWDPTIDSPTSPS